MNGLVIRHCLSLIVIYCYLVHIEFSERFSRIGAIAYLCACKVQQSHIVYVVDRAWPGTDTSPVPLLLPCSPVRDNELCSVNGLHLGKLNSKAFVADFVCV